MAKRLVDIVVAVSALTVAAPVIAVAAIAVRLSSKGPAFYRAKRAGRYGVPFTLFKLRTMHVNQGSNASRVTGSGDPRIFAVGSLLRKTKIDELPQLWNILKGDMSVVGPRPEDMDIVEQHFDDLAHQTLTIRPGLAGVSSIYNYTHGEKMLTGDNPEQVYVEKLLPIKMALEVAYLQNMSLGYDIRLMFRTAAAILQITLGKTEFPDPPEMQQAINILQPEQSQPAAFVGRAA